MPTQRERASCVGGVGGEMENKISPYTAHVTGPVLPITCLEVCFDIKAPALCGLCHLTCPTQPALPLAASKRNIP